MNGVISPSTSHPAVFNMHEPVADRVRQDLYEIDKRNEVRQNALRYWLISQALQGKEIDVTLDPSMFAVLNQERMCIEDYMSFFPQDTEDASFHAKEIRQLNNLEREGRFWNRDSAARYGEIGSVPCCVQRLYCKVYPETKEHRKAIRRFLNNFEEFRICKDRIPIR